MIVEPDFLDHWKTRMLARLLKDERAPIYVIRLWAHCQQRKTDRFTDWNPDVLASVCRWETDGLTLWEAMGKTFLEIDGGNVVVHGWAQTNAALISAWENGKRGGRPKAVNIDPQKPSENPPVNPPQTDRLTDREDKRREDRRTPKAPKGAEPVGFADFWEVYPRKESKVKAINAWKKAEPDQETQSRILKDVVARKASEAWTKENGQYIPHPASYLNQRRWEDLIEVPQTKEMLADKLRAHPGNPNHVAHSTATSQQLSEFSEMLTKYKAMP